MQTATAQFKTGIVLVIKILAPKNLLSAKEKPSWFFDTSAKKFGQNQSQHKDDRNSEQRQGRGPLVRVQVVLAVAERWAALAELGAAVPRFGRLQNAALATPHAVDGEAGVVDERVVHEVEGHADLSKPLERSPPS